MKRNWIAATSVAALALLAAAVAVQPTPALHAQTPAPTPATPASASPAQTIPLKLTERIAGTYGFGPGEPVKPQILVGQMPPALSDSLPLPESVTIVGSVARSDTGAMIFGETAETPEAVLSLIGERLKASGWTMPTASNTMPGGFVPSGPGFGLGATYCKGEDGPTLNVSIEPVQEPVTLTAVSLTYIAHQPDGYSYTACNQPPMVGMNPTMRLPTLRGPQGARQSGGGASSGGDRSSTYASFITSATVTALLDHFGAQLKAAGWKEGEKGGNGPVAWSRWTTKADDKGKTQSGLLFVLEEGTTQPSRLVFLQVMSPGARSTAVRETITEIARPAP